MQIIMKWIGKASRKIKLTFRCFLGLEHQLGAPGSFVSSTDDHDDYLDCCLFMLLCIFMILKKTMLMIYLPECGWPETSLKLKEKFNSGQRHLLPRPDMGLIMNNGSLPCMVL